MDKFLQTINKYSLIKKNDRILVGVSGGPDSVALLLKLAGIKSRMGLTLFIAHLDHGLRKDSHQDAQFVQNLGKKLGLPVMVKRLQHVQGQIKGGTEEFLRLKRLEFLIQVAGKVKANKVALGHNLDDQAETVLMRILRGTGLSGLSAISAKKKLHGVEFIRPLLETPRSAIESFLKKRGVKACLDSTNKEELFLRNKLRLHLIPLLKAKYNPNIVEVLANLSQSAACDYEYLEQQACRALKGDPARISLEKVTRLHPALLRLRLRQAIASVQGNTRRISLTHIRELEELIFSRPTGSVVDLPKGLSAKKILRALIFYKR